MTGKQLLLIGFTMLGSILNVQCQDPCAIQENQTVSYIEKLGCFGDFNKLQGAPLSSKYGQVKSLKIVYSLYNDRIYYLSSDEFPFHFNFCAYELGYESDLNEFNESQYSSGNKREYALANLTYYSSADRFALDFFSGDGIPADIIIRLYQKVMNTTFIGKNLFVFIGSQDFASRVPALAAKIPLLFPNDIYKGLSYQALNIQETYGFLRKVDITQNRLSELGPHDVVVMNSIPANIPVVAGMLTAEFQTPLSHINVLSHNRGTPNAACKGIWNSPLVQELVNAPVHFIVKQDTFLLIRVAEEEVLAYWKKKKDEKIINLQANTTKSGLQEMAMLSHKSVDLVGGKAANFAELSKVSMKNKALPVPENAFAIPFFYYRQHIENNHIHTLIAELLNTDSLRNNKVLLAERLKQIRKLIKSAPVDEGLLQAIDEKIKQQGYKAYRFRSSTNAEDIPGFNGAGLYDSKTGIYGDTTKPVADAIRDVWASLWNLRAFSEREYFKINQKTVAMGILVHRSFGEEEANGVAITRNLYRENYSGVTVNVQKGETSVVFPPDSVTCDQMIVNTAWISVYGNMYIEYISNSSLTNGKPVMTEEEVVELTKYLGAIKKHFYRIALMKSAGMLQYDNFSMDVEFKLDARTRKIYIKQARPY